MKKQQQPEYKQQHTQTTCQCLFFNGQTYVQDHYDYEFSNFIYYFLFDAFPPRLKYINNMDLLMKHKRITKHRRSICQVYQCPRGRYHIRGRTNKRKYPMLYKTLQIIKELHGQDHNEQQQMKRNAKTNYQYNEMIIHKYIYGFLIKCEVCTKKRMEMLPNHISYRQCIYEAIQNIERDKLSFQTPEEHEQLKNIDFNLETCEYDCTTDCYNEKDQGFLDYYIYKKIPDYLKILPKEQRQLRIVRMRNIITEYKVIKCTAGTNHFWRTRGPSLKKKFITGKIELTHKRIPMEKEKQFLMKKIHGQYHRPLCDMLVLAQNSPFCYSNLKHYFEENNYFCEECKQKRTNNPVVKSSLTEELKQIRQQKRKRKTKKQVKYEEDHRFGMQKVQKNKLKNKLTFCLQQIKIQDTQLIVNQYDKENSYITIISSGQMKENYRRYGDCLHFQRFSDLLDTSQGWYTYFFSGLNKHAEEIIFAICLIYEQKFQNFYHAIELFIETMKSRPPKTIATTYDKQIGQAIDSLLLYNKMLKKQTIRHVYFGHSIIARLLKQVSTKNSKQSIALFMKLLKARSHSQYLTTVNAIDNLCLSKDLLDTKSCLRQIIAQNIKCCVAKMPRMYMRKAIMNEKNIFYLQVKNNLKAHASLSKFLQKALRLIKTIQLSSGRTEERVQFTSRIFRPQFGELEKLKHKLPFSLYKQLLENCKISQNLVLMKEMPLKVRLKELNQIVQLDYQLDQGFWRCQCGALERTGMPCAHLIKIIIRQKGLIEYYINTRWIRSQQDFD